MDIDIEKELKEAIEKHQGIMQQINQVNQSRQVLMNQAMMLQGRIEYLNGLKAASKNKLTET